MLPFRHYLRETLTVEWPREVYISGDSRAIKASDQRPVIKHGHLDVDTLIPFGEDAFGAEAFEKMFDERHRRAFAGWNDVMSFLKSQSPRRLKLLDGFLGRLYPKGGGVSLSEFFKLVSGERQREALESVLDQLEGKPDGGPKWHFEK